MVSDFEWQGVLEGFWAPLGAFLGRFWVILGDPGTFLCESWTVSGPLGSVLGGLRPLLGAHGSPTEDQEWPNTGAESYHMHLGETKSHGGGLGAIVDALGMVLGGLGLVLG